MFLILLNILEFFIFLKINNFFFFTNYLYIFSVLINNNLINILILFFLLAFFSLNKNFSFIFFYFSFKLYMLKIYKFEIINKNLNYGLVNIHPLIFYCSLIILVIYFIKINNLNIHVKLNTLLLWSLFTFFLGGLWSLGNSSWGYFWLQDPIEIELLFVILLLLIFIHINFFNYNIFYFLIIFFILIIYILFFRFGFILTRHNFFDIKLLANLFIFYFFSLNLKLLNISILVLVIGLSYYTLFILFCKYLYQIKKKIYFYYNYYLLIHLVLFLLFITFNKYKENNISFVSLYQVAFNSTFFYFFHTTMFQYYIIISNLYIVKLYLSINFLYKYKLILNAINIFLSYSFFTFIVGLLISTLKIVPK